MLFPFFSCFPASYRCACEYVLDVLIVSGLLFHKFLLGTPRRALMSNRRSGFQEFCPHTPHPVLSSAFSGFHRYKSVPCKTIPPFLNRRLCRAVCPWVSICETYRCFPCALCSCPIFGASAFDYRYVPLQQLFLCLCFRGYVCLDESRSNTTAGQLWCFSHICVLNAPASQLQ